MISAKPLYRNRRFGQADFTLEDWMWEVPPDEGWDILEDMGLNNGQTQDATQWAQGVGTTIGAGAEWVLAHADEAINLYRSITGKQPPSMPVQPPRGDGNGFKIDTTFLLVGGLVLFLLFSQPWRK